MCVRKSKAGKAKKPKSAVRKIYKTTDGYLSGRADIKKPRRVAVIDQRKDDGALAVVKIYSQKDKQGKAFLKRPVLKPKKHPSLSEPSIVGKKVIVQRFSVSGNGRQTPSERKHRPASLTL